MTPYYDQDGVTIYNGDCLHVLPALPNNSVDLILTDPPYFKVKGDAWDNQWDKPGDFLAWLDRVLAEFARVLKPNGSLYLFASPQMGARVECLVGGRFQVLNSIRWRKEEGYHKATCKEELRAFFPASETIIFAEHVGADNAAKGESGYERKCDELRGFVFEPVRKYLDDERIRCGVSKKAIETATGTQMCSHWFTQSQWALPTAEHYATLQRLFNESSGGDFLRKEYDFLRKEYDELRKEYDELRKEYDELRRPFSVSSKVPYTDVWDFETVGNYPGRHVCEKPAPMLRHIISASSKPGAVVLDAFGGSGSTANAARQLGRRAISIELCERWCRRQVALVSQGILPI
jgi:site-specific DNA-methyltransferase (adenine-specific)